MEDQFSTDQNLIPLTWLQRNTESVDRSTESAEDKSKNCPIQVSRDENGKLLPGASLNPAGKPKSILISDAYKEILRRDGAEKYAAVVTEIALTGKRNSDRLAAIEMVTDRLEGKATQRIDTRGVFVVMAPETANLAQLDAWADE